MTHLEKLQSIDTLLGLYQFREHLLSIANAERKPGLDIADLEKRQEANFFIRRVDARIEYLECRGHSVDKIKNEPED